MHAALADCVQQSPVNVFTIFTVITERFSANDRCWALCQSANSSPSVQLYVLSSAAVFVTMLSMSAYMTMFHYLIIHLQQLICDSFSVSASFCFQLLTFGKKTASPFWAVTASTVFFYLPILLQVYIGWNDVTIYGHDTIVILWV